MGGGELGSITARRFNTYCHIDRNKTGVCAYSMPVTCILRYILFDPGFENV
jgi:hypothetical protein